jgi:hypothetical protein
MDANAAAYITAVETADGQTLEEKTKIAIDNFVLGCKADGTWTAIKASCILAGARTLAGALVPLVGAAPTPFAFLEADYNRKTGLKGNGSTKYLNSNRANNADPQNSNHLCVYVSTAGSNALYDAYAGQETDNPTSYTSILRATDGGGRMLLLSRSNNGAQQVLSAQNATGFIGVSRNSSSISFGRCNSATTSFSSTSATPNAANVWIFAKNYTNSAGFKNYTSARLAFYSIGESLDLALLDARVTALITAFAAIP